MKKWIVKYSIEITIFCLAVALIFQVLNSISKKIPDKFIITKVKMLNITGLCVGTKDGKESCEKRLENYKGTTYLLGIKSGDLNCL